MYTGQNLARTSTGVLRHFGFRIMVCNGSSRPKGGRGV